MGCHILLQGIFPTQGSNLGILQLPALAGPAEGMKLAEKMIMEKLNKRFTRKEYLQAAAECGVCEKSADRYLGQLQNRYKLAIRVQNGIFEMLK